MNAPDHPARPQLRRILLVGLGLLLLSRAPFLVQNVDWGVFDLEHLWILGDARASSVARAAAEGAKPSLADLDPGLYGEHFHAGARVVTAAMRLVGDLTGSFSLRGLKLLGLLGSCVALAVYLATLTVVWPAARVRWAVMTYVVWLAPPTLFLWMTLMPMGHYMETWFVHALWMGGLVLILRDRAGPVALTGMGIASGLACVYVFSNVVFPALLAGALLLSSKRPWRSRLAGLAALTAGAAAVYVPFALPRISMIVDRLGSAGPSESASTGLVTHSLENLAGLLTTDLIALGDGWCYRGFFALFEPPFTSGAVTAAYVLATVAAGGALFLLMQVARLVLGRTRAEMTLGQRVLAANGVLLVCFLLAYVLFVRSRATPEGEMEYVSYLTLSYPPLLLGIGAGCARLLELRPRVASVPVGLLLLLLGAGWVHSAAWATRTIDRPEVQGPDQRDLGRLLLLMTNESGDPKQMVDLCVQAFPGDEAYCRTRAWEITLRARYGEWGDLLQYPGACRDVGDANRGACEAAFGAAAYGVRVEAGDEFGEHAAAKACGPATDPRGRGCLTGAYRSTPHDPFDVPFWSLMHVLDLCRPREPGGPHWYERACLETTAWMMSGMPTLPAGTGTPSAACAAWPEGWVGLCQSLSGVRQAGPDELSCEDAYLALAVPALPERNLLIHQQCALADYLPRHNKVIWDRGFPVPSESELPPERARILPGFAIEQTGAISFLPSCVIGVARALDGLECSWRGSDLTL